MKEFLGPVYDLSDEPEVTLDMVHRLHTQAMRRMYALPPFPKGPLEETVRLVPMPDAQPVLLLTPAHIRQLLNDPRVVYVVPTLMNTGRITRLYNFEVREVI